MKDFKLVYSTDPETNRKCIGCKELQSECTCKSLPLVPEKITVVLRIEKAKRGGKIVTVLAKLPPVEEFLSKLARDLKNKFGCGGTHGVCDNEGFIEIQGERRDVLRELLKARGMTVKG